MKQKFVKYYLAYLTNEDPYSDMQTYYLFGLEEGQVEQTNVFVGHAKRTCQKASKIITIPKMNAQTMV